MRTIGLMLLLIWAISRVYAQDYQISFAGSGASNMIDSVRVENLTQGTSLKLVESDILLLSGATEIKDLKVLEINTVIVSPNPTMTGNCSFDFEATAWAIATFKLFDVKGNKVIDIQKTLTKGHHTYSLSGLSGIYILKIESDKFSYSAKIISNNAIFGTVEMNQIETKYMYDKQDQTSSIGKTGRLKSLNSLKYMQYNPGDRLKLIGKSGIYRTVYMLIPSQNQTVTFNFISCTDADNNNYSTVQIGTQVWMVENLRTTKYRNGEQIPEVTDSLSWEKFNSGVYCNYNNTNDNDTIEVFGRLYNWSAVNDGRAIAPVGWHIPTEAEWEKLITYLGGENIAGAKLKETGTTHWQSPNTGATNESGFTALPGGYRVYKGAYDIGNSGQWWSSTFGSSSDAAWGFTISYDNTMAKRFGDLVIMGYSVRCVKD